MKVELIEGKSAAKSFSEVCTKVYKGNPYYRGTEGSIEELLLFSKSAFQSHAIVKKFVLRDGNELVARFSLIHDHRLPDYVQVSYFEALSDLGDIFSLIKKEAIRHFPDCYKIVVGLNGHLNYGAGILLNRFDEVPLFGLPYNPAYYADYFKELQCRKMVTFRLSMEVYSSWANAYNAMRPIPGLKVRFMNKSKINEESAVYTLLNNQAFIKHPYWANRDSEEDLELFYPFRFLLDNENLIFAEVDGEPVGFFLWYPDFNQLVTSQRDLNALDLLKFRFHHSIDTMRFTEIGIIPEYQGSSVAMAMLSKCLPFIMNAGYKYCEGGFIFEENRASIAFVKRMIQRSYGENAEPYRQFATYETTLK